MNLISIAQAKTTRLWIGKGTAAVLDQGLFAGSNFIFSILLARWLLPVEYGAFSIGIAIFLLASGLFTAIVLEPMSVIGSTKYQQNSTGYLLFLVKAHLCVTLALSALLMTGSLVFRDEVASVIRGIAIALPFILLFWLFRWLFYMQAKSERALLGTLIYLLCLFIGISIAKDFSFISAKTAFLVMGVSGVIGAFGMFWLHPLAHTQEEYISTKTSALEHWNYGKWIAIASLLQWNSDKLYIILAGSLLGLQNVGGMRAIQNFAQPLEQTSTALGLLLIPWGSRLFSNREIEKFRRLTFWINFTLGAIGIVYLLFIWLLKDPLILLVYKGQFVEFTWLIPYLIGIPIIMSLSRGAQIGVRAIHKPKTIMYAYFASTLVTFAIGPFLLLHHGLLGAAIGMLLSSITFSISLNIIFWKETRRLR